MRHEIERLTVRDRPADAFITVDRSRCTGCGACARVCLPALWRMRGGVAVLAPGFQSACLECAACWQVCEAGAIAFRFPPGGTGIAYRNG